MKYITKHRKVNVSTTHLTGNFISRSGILVEVSGSVILRRVALAPAQLVCLGVQAHHLEAVLPNKESVVRRVSGFEQFCLSRDSGKKIALIPGSPGKFYFFNKTARIQYII